MTNDFKKNDVVIFDDSGSKDIRIVSKVTQKDCHFTNGGMAKKNILKRICSLKEIEVSDLREIIKHKQKK